MERIERIKGCLYGGAAGDALGYAVEFINIDQIKAIYGEDGIREYSLTDGKAIFSDDTQMTLFTCEAIINSAKNGYKDVNEETYRSFISWLSYDSMNKENREIFEYP